MNAFDFMKLFSKIKHLYSYNNDKMILKVRIIITNANLFSTLTSP
jgi:hypothetical protein